jgi:hypothetical protein
VVDDGQAQERVRRARRVAWAFRLTFYPAAIGVAVLLLAARGGGGEFGGFLQGTTSQGHVISLTLNEDNDVTYLDTQITSTCERGGEWVVRWWSDSTRTTFHRDGSRLEVRDEVARDYDGRVSGRRDHRLTAEVDDDDAEGELAFTEQVEWPSGEGYECASGTVTFTAQR